MSFFSWIYSFISSDSSALPYHCSHWFHPTSLQCTEHFPNLQKDSVFAPNIRHRPGVSNTQQPAAHWRSLFSTRINQQGTGNCVAPCRATEAKPHRSTRLRMEAMCSASGSWCWLTLQRCWETQQWPWCRGNSLEKGGTRRDGTEAGGSQSKGDTSLQGRSLEMKVSPTGDE